MEMYQLPKAPLFHKISSINVDELPKEQLALFGKEIRAHAAAVTQYAMSRRNYLTALDRYTTGTPSLRATRELVNTEIAACKALKGAITMATKRGFATQTDHQWASAANERIAELEQWAGAFEE